MRWLGSTGGLTLSADRPVSGIKDVPDVSANWYLDVVEFANSTPGFVRTSVHLFTEGSLLILFAMVGLCAWRARRLPARHMAVVLLTPVGILAGYFANDTIKSIFEVGRPCRLLPEITTIAACDPPGDWSFPSNHSAVAGASVVAVIMAWRLLGVPALLVGGAATASRVFVGAHFPHDAAVGFLVGAFVVLAVILIGGVPATWMVERQRENPRFGRLLVDSRWLDSHRGEPRADLSRQPRNGDCPNTQTRESRGR